MSIVRKEEDEDVIDLLAVGRLLLGKAHLILLSTLFFGLVAYAGVFFLVTPKYTAYTTLYVNNNADRDSDSSITQGDLNASAQLVDTYAAIILSNKLLQQVIDSADVDMTTSQLASNIKISAVNDTEVFKVSVTDPDPKKAALLANAVSDVAPAQIAEIVEGSSVKVVDFANVPTEISSPSYKKYIVFGMAFGFVLAVMIIFIMAMMDTTIKTESDFEQFGIPVLSTIPDLNSATKSKKYGNYGYGAYGKAGR